MINKTHLKVKLSNFLPKIRAPKDIFSLFQILSYPKDSFFDTSYKRKLEEFELKVEEKRKIKNIYTILNFQKNLTVFLIEVKTLSSRLIKYLARIFSERYDCVLLVITRDYYSILFVLPDYERGPKGKPRLRITKLYVGD